MDLYTCGDNYCQREREAGVVAKKAGEREETPRQSLGGKLNNSLVNWFQLELLAIGIQPLALCKIGVIRQPAVR